MVHKKKINVVGVEYITDYIQCDMCGIKFHKNKDNEDGSIDIDNLSEEYNANNMIQIHKLFGYGSKVGDEEELMMDICEDCFIKIFGMDKILSCCFDPETGKRYNETVLQ